MKPARVIISKEYILFFIKSTWDIPIAKIEKLNPYRKLIVKYLKHRNVLVP